VTGVDGSVRKHLDHRLLLVELRASMIDRCRFGATAHEVLVTLGSD
jgi:hypothetical protein